MRNLLTHRGRWSFFFFIATLLTIAVSSIRNIWDQDVWWNLAAGRWMWMHHAVPRIDSFSFTVQGHPWIDHEWLFQALLFGAYKAAAIPGILLFKAMLVATAAAGLWWAFPVECPALMRAVLTLTAFHWMAFRNMARADLVLFAVFPWILGTYGRWWMQPMKERLPRAAWGCAAAMLVLANCHGGFLSLVIITLLFALCEALRRNRAGDAFMPNPYVICLGLYIPALLCNPYGVRLFGGIVHTAFRLGRYDGSDFMEYIPAGFSEFPAFWLFYLAWGVRLVWQWRRDRAVDALSLTLFLFAGLLARMFRRNIPLGVMISVPFAAYAWRERMPGTIPRGLQALGVLLIAGCCVFEARGMRWGIQAERYPIQLAAFARTQFGHGACYNDYDLGSYLIWDWYDSPLRVFIDGRMHAIQGYLELWQSTRDLAGVNPAALTGWHQLTKRWGFDLAAIQIPPAPIVINGHVISKLAYFFPTDRWALVYVDPRYALYARRQAYPKTLIDRWEIKRYWPDTRASTASTAIPWPDLVPRFTS